MKKRLPLLLLFTALAAVALWLWRNNTGSTLDKDLADFVVPDTSSVDRIFIAETSGRAVDLVRTPQGWTVNGMPANNHSVRTLLKTFQRVEVRAPVPKSAADAILKGLAVGARKVEIYTGGKRPEKIWYVGPGAADRNSTYMLLEKPGVGRSASPFAVGIYGRTGTLDTRFHANVDDWRSLRLFSFPDLTRVQRVQVEHPAVDSAGFAITMVNGQDVRLLRADGTEARFDTIATRDVLLGLKEGNFELLERVLDRARRDSVLASPPWHVLTVTTPEGTQRIPFWRKDPNPGELDNQFRKLVDNPYRMFSVTQDTSLVVVQRVRYDPQVPYLHQVLAR